MLFRIALAILKMNEAELLGCESIPAVYVALENLPTRMWRVDPLLQVRLFAALHRQCIDYFFLDGGGTSSVGRAQPD